MASKAEAVVHGGGYDASDGLVGCVIQIAIGVGFDLIDGGWNHVVVTSQGRQGHFNATTGSQGMSQVSLGA